MTGTTTAAITTEKGPDEYPGLFHWRLCSLRTHSFAKGFGHERTFIFPSPSGEGIEGWGACPREKPDITHSPHPNPSNEARDSFEPEGEGLMAGNYP